MIIKCLTLDDEPLALSKMASYISKTPFLELTGACRSGYEAGELISKTRVDLIFIDINMPDMNGLDFVRTLHNKPQIIFTTAFSEYAIEGFKLDAIDYLLKPIGYPEFLKAANKARSYFETVAHDQKRVTDTKEYLFVKSDYKTVKINLDDILYIEGLKDYVKIFTGPKPILTLQSLKSLEEKFRNVNITDILTLIIASACTT